MTIERGLEEGRMLEAVAGDQADERDRSEDETQHEPPARRAVLRDRAQPADQPEYRAEDQPESEDHGVAG